MSLGSPWMLLGLALVPLLVLGLLVVCFAGAEGAPRGSPRKGSCRPRLHGTRAGATSRSRFFVTGIALVVFALARPTVNVAVPEREGTVILAFDVSNSMLAKDLKPDADRGGEGRCPRLRGRAAGDDQDRRGGIR